jgi:hypothetical protein
MVWGSMIALSTIALLRADEIYLHRQRIQDAMAEGSVITVDNGVKVLAAAAATDEIHRAEMLPYLLLHLRTCRPKDVPQHAEAVVQAVDAAHTEAFVAVLESRLAAMTATEAARLRRVIRRRQAEGGKKTSSVKRSGTYPAAEV